MDLVNVIRECPIIGRGTCSSVDECLTDGEIKTMLDESEIKTNNDAIKWGIDFEEMQLSRALDCRWGEDSDPELIAWNKFQDKIKQHYPNLAK